MFRYDNVCETLAVRILNIKNIPKNNKEVGNLSMNISFFLYRQEIIEFYLKKTHLNCCFFQIGMIYKTYISICLVSCETEFTLKKYKTKRYDIKPVFENSRLIEKVPDERSERRAYQTNNTFSDHNPVRAYI